MRFQKSKIQNGKEMYTRRVKQQIMRSKFTNSKCFNKKNFHKKNDKFWFRFVKDLCKNSSFHGLNHFVDPELHVIEKILWGCLLAFAITGAGYSSLEIWKNFIETTTETVVETTYFKNADVAFPAVIICDASSVDWSRVSKLNSTLLPEYTAETEPLFTELLYALSTVTFGDFIHLDRIKKYKHLFPKINTLQITELLIKVMRPCEEVFVGDCWWRSHRVDCCSIFELQKTEYGFCYSFNSDISEYSKKLSEMNAGIDSFWRDPDGVLRPRRTGSKGIWSGLRVTINVPSQTKLPPNFDAKSGIKVLIGEPRAYLMDNEINVAAGQFANIHVWGDRIYSTDRLRGLDPKKRHCLFDDESKTLGLKYYFRQNCKIDCYKSHAFKYCKCSPEFMFFELNENNPKFPPCTIEDLLCLNEYNMIFSNMIPIFGHTFFDPNESGMLCDCLPDCAHQMYNSEATIIEDSNSSNEVLLDVHFRQSTCILYRNDITFGFLDLLVSFGGCTGLFLGGSLLSCVELIYFITLRLYYHWNQWKKLQKIKNDAVSYFNIPNYKLDNLSKK